MLQAVNSLTHTTDALLFAEFNVIHDTDAALKAINTVVNHTTDAFLSGSGSIVHTTDALLKSIDDSLTHNTDALLFAQFSKNHTTDALIRAADNLASHTTDALLQAANNSLTHTTDAFLSIVGNIEHDTDSLLKSVDSSLVHTTDAYIQSGASVIHSTDTLLQAIDNSLTHNTDALLFAEASLTHSTDTFLIQTESVQHSTDAYLKQLGITKDHSTDALLRSEANVFHTTDSYLVQVGDVFHTTDAFLSKTFSGSGSISLPSLELEGIAGFQGPGQGNLVVSGIVVSGSGDFIPYYRPSSAGISLPSVIISGSGEFTPPPSNLLPKRDIRWINRNRVLVPRWDWGVDGVPGCDRPLTPFRCIVVADDWPELFGLRQQLDIIEQDLPVKFPNNPPLVTPVPNNGGQSQLRAQQLAEERQLKRLKDPGYIAPQPIVDDIKHSIVPAGVPKLHVGEKKSLVSKAPGIVRSVAVNQRKQQSESLVASDAPKSIILKPPLVRDSKSKPKPDKHINSIQINIIKHKRDDRVSNVRTKTNQTVMAPSSEYTCNGPQAVAIKSEIVNNSAEMVNKNKTIDISSRNRRRKRH